MQYRTLGKTDLRISEVGFGVWTLTTGWWGKFEEPEMIRMLRLAHDMGVNFFDTADVYGNGYGEEVLARALEPVRQDCVIATKIGYDFYNHERESGQREHPQDYSPKFVRFAVEQCLRRLNSDHIDWLQLHNPRLETLQDDDLFVTMADLQSEGKVRWWGAALGPAIGWRDEGVYAAGERGLPLQIIHNLLEQEPGDDFIAAARTTGAGLIARVPHSSGLLEGQYTADTVFPPGDHRNHRPRSWLIEGVQKVEQLRFLERKDRSLGQAAIQWLLAEPLMASVLPNIYNEEQLREFAAASEAPGLTPEELDRVQTLVNVNFGIVREEVPA